MKNKNTSILFVSITIAMLGYGIALPILPFYLDIMGGSGLHLGMLVASYGVMQLSFAPVWGSLSDKYGRKPLLLLGMSGLGIAMLLFGLSTKLWMLYAAQIVSGALTCAMFPVSMAYIGDITDKENISGAMGKVGAAVGLGMILGPGMGGLLATKELSTPFFIAAGISLLTFFIILLGLPESLPTESRIASVGKRKIIHIKSLWQAMFTPMAFGLFTACAVNFGKSNFSSVYSLFALEKFQYGPQEVGSILMIMSVMYVIAQGFLVGPLTTKYGEVKVINVSLFGNSIGFILILLADSYITMIISISVFILFNALLKPSALAFVSKHSEVGQGMAMGLTESYMSLGRITGPIWPGVMFDVNMNYPFVSGSVFFILMFIVSIIFKANKFGNVSN
jgi:DHA1 family multidrug resistance protein-like MFS transporter